MNDKDALLYGPALIHPRHAKSAADGMILLMDPPDEDDSALYNNDDGVAVVAVSGPILYDAGIYELLGYASARTIDRAILEANDDPDVSAIVLDIDSPGGTVTGIEEVGLSIRKSAKPVIAHTATMAASAAYWLASQARAVYATESSEVGSIGVYVAHIDMSRAYDQMGVRVDLIKSSETPQKGAFYPGTALTDEQRAREQAQVDYLKGRFVTAVKSRRPNVQESAFDGSTFYGRQALAVGLIDSIAPLSRAISDARKIAT